MFDLRAGCLQEWFNFKCIYSTVDNNIQAHSGMEYKFLIQILTKLNQNLIGHCLWPTILQTFMKTVQ